MQQTMQCKAFASGARLTARPAASRVVMAALKKGDKVPAFTLKDQSGKTVTVKFGGFGSKAKVVFFYPKAATPGCTLEARAFKESYSQLAKLGAEVFGISNDTPDAQNAFSCDLELPYKLLCDEGDAVRNLFGVPKDLFGLLPGRQSYVIAKDGTIEQVYNNQFKPESHVEEAIKALTK